jgi:hypothetical protein
MTIFTKITTNEYKELLNSVQFKTCFHEIEWHDFLEKQFKWLEFEYYLYGDKVILPLAKFKVFDKEKLISLPFCEYGGPLIISPNLPAGRQGFGKGGPDINIEEFEKDVLQQFGKGIKVKFHPQILSYEAKPRKPRKDVKGMTSDISTYWIEGFKNTTEQEIRDSFRKTLRHEIKHAQDQGLVIRRSKNPKEMKKFYDLYVANLRRKKTIPYPWQIVQFLCQNPSNELLLAFYKGKIIGGSLFLKYSGFTHYFLSATDIRHKNLGSNYLILWEKIKSLVGKDIILDLGATPKDSSLYTFKSGWGGKEYPIIILKKEKNPEKLRSSRVRNLFILLPNFIIKLLSKRFIKYRV